MSRNRNLPFVCLFFSAFVLAFLCPQGASAQTGPFCVSNVVTEKCIVSVTTTNPANAANITASVQFSSSTGAYTVTVRNTGNADTYELSPALTTTASTVTVVFKAAANPSTADPKIAVSTGLISNWAVDTSVSPHQIT